MPCPPGGTDELAALFSSVVVALSQGGARGAGGSHPVFSEKGHLRGSMIINAAKRCSIPGSGSLVWSSVTPVRRNSIGGVAGRMGEVALVAGVDPAAAEGAIGKRHCVEGRADECFMEVIDGQISWCECCGRKNNEVFGIVERKFHEYVGKACLVSTCSGKADLPRVRSSIPIFVGKKRCDKL